MIRLLAPYQFYKNNQIVSFAADWERYLVLSGAASTDLTGGIPYVAPAAPRRLVPASLVVNTAGAVLGIEGPGGTLIAVGGGNITAPGAPTGLTLTAAAGAVVAAFTLPSNTGGSPITSVTVTLSNGQSNSGLTSPITIATPAGTAVTATAKAANDFFESAASSVSNSVTPTTVATPAAPTVSSAPIILGTPTVGVAVTATAGVFNGSPTPTIVRSWLVAGVVVATAATYTPIAADVGKALTVREVATNTVNSVTSNSNPVNIAAASVEYAEVVIFAGQSQSNSNGTSQTGGDVPASLQGPMTNAFTWDPFNNVWLTYEAGVNSAVHLEGGKYPLPGAKYHGMEAEYLRRWREQNPGVPIYMIKKGHSTTSIDQAARTTNRGCWDPALVGDLFDELVSWVAAAYASIRALGKTPRLRAINWIQGENEADVSVAANRYQATLETFITAVRNRVEGTETAPFVISRIQTATWNFPALIRSAQVAVAANTANNARWFDADSAAVSSDMVHYSPAGCLTLGRICYEANLSASDIAARYFSRMTVAPSSARQAALATLFAALASKSVWPTITALQLYASHDQQSALVSSGYVAATGVPTNETFVADQGFTGSGTGSHIDTGYSLATSDPRYMANSNSQSVWIRSKASDSGIDLGAFTGGATILAMVVGNTAIRVNAASDSGNIVTAVTKRTGLNTVMRLGASDSRLFQDGAQLGATATSPVGAIPTGNVWVGDRSGGSSAPTVAQYSAFIAGMGRTATQEADLYAALNAYLTSIGAA